MAVHDGKLRTLPGRPRTNGRDCAEGESNPRTFWLRRRRGKVTSSFPMSCEQVIFARSYKKAPDQLKKDAGTQTCAMASPVSYSTLR